MVIQMMNNMFQFSNAIHRTMVETFKTKLNRFNVLVWVFILGCSVAMAATSRNDDHFFYSLCAYLFVLTSVLFTIFFFTVKFTNTLIATVEAPALAARNDSSNEMHAVADRLKSMKKFWSVCIVGLVVSESLLLVLRFSLGAIPFSWAIIHLPALVLSVFAPLATASLFPKTTISMFSGTGTPPATATPPASGNAAFQQQANSVMIHNQPSNPGSTSSDQVTVSQNVTAVEDIA
jgi:hypothetical protein